MKRTMKKNLLSSINPPAIPAEMRKRRQWVCYFEQPQANGKSKKVPLDPKTGRFADPTNHLTWSTYHQARSFHLMFLSPGCGGLGFVFTREDPYVGVDLDNCRDPETGQIDAWALEVVQCLDSYTEVSPSGTGLHIFVRGVLPPGSRKRGNIEMYDRNRYFTITGIVLPGMSQIIQSRQGELEVLHACYLGQGISDSKASGQQSNTTQPKQQITLQELQQAELTPADREMFRRLLSGQHGQQYRLLALGAWRRAGYYSQSEADLAMLNLLARLTDGSVLRMSAIFRASGLMREKIKDHPTYLSRSIQKAIAGLGWRPAHRSTAREEA
jgi:primase-polymerase (primpol)-like protein